MPLALTRTRPVRRLQAQAWLVGRRAFLLGHLCRCRKLLGHLVQSAALLRLLRTARTSDKLGLADMLDLPSVGLLGDPLAEQDLEAAALLTLAVVACGGAGIRCSGSGRLLRELGRDDVRLWWRLLGCLARGRCLPLVLERLGKGVLDEPLLLLLPLGCGACLCRRQLLLRALALNALLEAHVETSALLGGAAAEARPMQRGVPCRVGRQRHGPGRALVVLARAGRPGVQVVRQLRQLYLGLLSLARLAEVRGLRRPVELEHVQGLRCRHRGAGRFHRLALHDADQGLDVFLLAEARDAVLVLGVGELLVILSDSLAPKSGLLLAHLRLVPLRSLLGQLLRSVGYDLVTSLTLLCRDVRPLLLPAEPRSAFLVKSGHDLPLPCEVHFV